VYTEYTLDHRDNVPPVVFILIYKREQSQIKSLVMNSSNNPFPQVERKDLIRYAEGFHKANLNRPDSGFHTMCIWGKHGMAKTSIKHTLREMGYDVIDFNPAQFEEMGDLQGLPDKVIMDGIKRTVYALPDFATAENDSRFTSPKGGFYLLDDFNRANRRLLLGLMQFLQDQSMGGWKLPKNWTIIATANPSNGDYQIQEIDNASLTRMHNFTIKLNEDDYLDYMIERGFDMRVVAWINDDKEVLSNMNTAGSSDFTVLRTLDSFQDAIKMYPGDFSDETGKAGALKGDMIRLATDLTNIAKATIDDVHAAKFMHYMKSDMKKMLTAKEIIANDLVKSYEFFASQVYTKSANGEKQSVSYVSLCLRLLFDHMTTLYSNGDTAGFSKGLRFITLDEPKLDKDLKAKLTKLNMARMFANYIDDAPIIKRANQDDIKKMRTQVLANPKFSVALIAAGAV